MNNKLRDVILSIIRDLRLPVNSKILDVGCGSGTTAFLLAKDGFKVTGLNLSAKKIKLAQIHQQQLELHLNFSVGNAEDIMYDDNSFDLVLVVESLEYIIWQRWAFQEINRVLKPGGYILIVSSNRLSLINLINPAWYAIELSAKFRAKLPEVEKISPKGENSGLYSNGKDSSEQDIIGDHKPQILSRITDNLQRTNYQLVFYDSIGLGPFYKSVNFERLKSDQSKARSYNFRNGDKQLWGGIGNELIVLAQKRITSEGTKKYSNSLSINDSVQRFETEHSQLFLSRQKWLTENKNYVDITNEKLEQIVGDRNRILVVSPHPDDEIIGCGGTIIKLLDQGKHVTVLHLTDGRNTAAFERASEDVRSNARLLEAKVVSDYLGFSELVLWKIPDNQIESNEENIERFTKLMDKVNPQVIFTPFVNDAHPDHRDANELLKNALSRHTHEVDDLLILGYECWSILPAMAVSVITDEFEKKATALMKYKIAMRVVDYVGFCESLDSYHNMNTFKKSGYAESFFVSDANTFIKLQNYQRVNPTTNE